MSITRKREFFRQRDLNRSKCLHQKTPKFWRNPWIHFQDSYFFTDRCTFYLPFFVTPTPALENENNFVVRILRLHSPIYRLKLYLVTITVNTNVSQQGKITSTSLTDVTPLTNALLANGPGPSTVSPSSSGPHEALYMSM